jgi:transcriptional regulator with XRE-family HTH domain
VTKYRKLAHLTQAQVAELIGMKSSSYSQMERVGDISAERIVKLAEVFGINVGLLLYGEEIELSNVPIVPQNDVVVLPKLPFGREYVPLKNKDKSIITVIHNLSQRHQKYICDLLDYLRKNKKTILPPFT